MHCHHVSVFGGIGAEILCAPRSIQETFNDADQTVTNFFRVLQDEKMTDQLLRRLSWNGILVTPYSEAEFRKAHALVDDPDPVIRAWAFLVLANMSRVGQSPLVVSRSAFGAIVGAVMHGHSVCWKNIVHILQGVAARFVGVQIRCRDWSHIIEQYDRPTTFFTLDPPYPLETGSGTWNGYYRKSFNVIDHVPFLHRVRKLQAKAMVFTSPNDLYDDLLHDWNRVDFVRKDALSSKRKKPVRVDRIFFKFSPKKKG